MSNFLCQNARAKRGLPATCDCRRKEKPDPADKYLSMSDLLLAVSAKLSSILPIL